MNKETIDVLESIKAKIESDKEVFKSDPYKEESSEDVTLGLQLAIDYIDEYLEAEETKDEDIRNI